MLLDKLAQDREKQMLEQENRQLRSLLKQYLDSKLHIIIILSMWLIHAFNNNAGISVNDEVLSRPNPLLVANRFAK